MSRPERGHISGNDALLVLETIETCLAADSDQDLYETVIPCIQKLFSFDYASLTLGTWQAAQRKWSPQALYSLNLPGSFWESYQKSNWIADPVVAESLRGRPHQHWSMTAGQTILDTGETRAPPLHPSAALLMDYGIYSGYTSAVAPAGPGESCSMITFCTGRDRGLDPRTRDILSHLTPHLHQALLRNQNNGKAPDILLSNRESEVLNWLKLGKSSWDISMVLGISERTVNFHVYNLMRKLGAINRPQAVAIAVSRGLIGLD
ncbi:LuxR C-terminal-related transcriptional regulator [Telmatospirillum sp.]|uniref:helix-turn-helix transcriptional regulator n=1 Tax=Telmatospirillum sp. TaxID=2079197 RepID=UPI002851C751|nr:LuxR C-terminal-related transcriptional regulator [Telmatospirillum sp.]MDR3438216.1 LuxR C-terminal-related transcriptional regulator [Telmatospirillum sp.]